MGGKAKEKLMSVSEDGQRPAEKNQISARSKMRPQNADPCSYIITA
jgi:hypothetical protein